MNRRLGEEKAPSQHHLSKYKYPVSSPSFEEGRFMSLYTYPD